MDLRVIEGGARGPDFRRVRPKQTAEGGFILPPIKLPTKAVLYDWIGLKPRQSNMAFNLALADENTFENTLRSLQRISAARRELEAAMTEHRQILLAAMLEHYPRAAGRIMKALKPKKR